MVPEHHRLNSIRTHTIDHTASGRGAILSESPPAPGTPDFPDYFKNGRLHSSCIDNNFCSAATWSCQRHAQPERSQQIHPLQYGKVKVLRKATPAHSNTLAAIGAAMISAGNSSTAGRVTVGVGSTQLVPKASQQSFTSGFRPASNATSSASAHLTALLSQAVARHHDLAAAQKPIGILPHPRLSALTGSGSADSFHAPAASANSKHLESLLSLAMAKHTGAAVAAAQLQPQIAARSPLE